MGKTELVKLVGLFMVLASFYFVFHELRSNREFLLAWRPDFFSTSLFCLCAIVYGMSQYLLSGGWIQLLRLTVRSEVDTGKCHRLYARTQIGKYIPGNVFHFVGRQVHGREAGYSHAALAGASLYECIGLVVFASALSLIGISAFGLKQGLFPQDYLAAVFVLSATALCAGMVLYPRLAKTVGFELKAKGLQVIVRALKKVMFLYSAFFLVSGCLLVLLVSSQVEHLEPEYIGIIGVISIFSWIAGFMTPGAPAGIGVREAVIVVLLAPLVGGSVATVSALLYRLVTAIGDVVFYFSARLVAPHIKV